ncbi:MAG: hypothetical protein EOO54_09425 [Haliea sp.]|nr:MAG: hypothetical protein EOO54_09425 [Haliea sp.]
MSAQLLTPSGAAGADQSEADMLLAAVLTLMTDHALACCEGRRAAVATRIAACFLALSRVPGVTARSRSLSMRLHARWLPAAAQNQHPGAQEQPGDSSPRNDNKVLWHTTPEFIQ